jgi:uncharacterized protein involved in exopolysaccharide biosynthesis
MDETGDSMATAQTERVGANSGDDHFGAPSPAARPRPEQSGIGEYVRVLWRRKWVIVLTVVLAVGGVLGYCVLVGKTYTATATVQLMPPISTLFTGTSGQQSTAASVNVQDIIQVMESSSVSNIVARTIPNPPSASVTQVGTATTLITSDIVQVSVSDSNKETAAAAANAYANAYISFQRGIEKSTFDSAEKELTNKVQTVQLAISNLNNEIRSTPVGVNQTAQEVQLGDLESQLTNLENAQQQFQFDSTQGTATEIGRVITPATVPSNPSSPKTTEYVVLALIFSLIAGIGLALLVNSISNRRV